jgi:hypothetical protein
MIRVTLDLLPREARALREACRHFQFGDAQHLLRHSRNIKPDSLCEAITRLRDALDAAQDLPNSR